MARYRGALCRLCRREGTKLFLKGERCMTPKCALTRRSYSPGQHGKRRAKLSDYALQLREKQKVRRIYGINEHQFRLYFEKAEKTKMVTGTVLLQLLERRLDNVIFSLGFAASRSQARQIVKHRFVCVNSRPVDIPSFLIKEKDVISIKSDEKKRKRLQEIIKLTKDRSVPEWLKVEPERLEGTVTRLPQREDIQFPIQEQLIVELYSK
ncbi:MAG: 30S ribosomal protein S4 [Candidatus Omnitrophota bacterium]|nr:MAG: 30S ribosomal protein S4 [Candidatus Omnitrophota bacterium]